MYASHFKAGKNSKQKLLESLESSSVLHNDKTQTVAARGKTTKRN